MRSCLDLDEVGQAQIDAACFLWDLLLADGYVGHDGQHQGLEGLVETVREALGSRHLPKKKPKTKQKQTKKKQGHETRLEQEAF